MTSNTAIVGGITMRWEESGEGMPVVFMHGIPTCPALWRHVTPRLNEARCLAWEMVGYGASIPEGRERDISVGRQADYLVSWLKHLGIEQAILAGHDLGGGVAQIAAVRHPGLCRGLFLTNAIGYDSWPIPSVKAMRTAGPVVRHFPDPAFKQIFRTFIHRGHDDSVRAEEAVETHWPHYDHHDGAAAFVRQVDSLDVNDTLAVADGLPGLGIPARIVWGIADRFQKIEYGERFARDLEAPLRRIEGAKHFTPEDHPEIVADELQELIDAVRPVKAGSALGETAGTDDLHDAIVTVRSLSEVMPQHADQKIRDIYEDIQPTLRVPFVNQLFRLLATDPAYLEVAWSHVGPIAQTRAFETAAKTLRGEAALAPVPEADGTDWEALGDVDRVLRFTASIQYVLPKLLLITSLLDPETRASGGSQDPGPAFSRGIAEGAEKIEMVDTDAADEPVRAIFEDIMNRHGHPTVATYFRSLAQWPDLLQAVWTRMRPLVDDGAYEARRAVLTRRASELSAALSGGAPPEPPQPCEAVLALFRQRVIPDLLIDVTMVRSILDKPDSVRANPLDIT